ncbi:nucleotidyl transferase AbiEii/AbiGii toxin family protein [Candidatus Sumerlaeota bacterium]|nr:nucleotidyl transferase AbiEii/AbiGii toxin family protein [Candidatus Sumerlaeota bacterium]
MNVAGFSEAAASAIHIGIQNDLTVPVVSLPALAVLKLSAWLERHTQTDKDALDFFLLARTYHGIADHANRFYGDEADLLRAADYDPELAGAALLGRDAAGLCSAATGNRLQQLFSGSALRQKLIDQMTRTSMQLGDEQAAAKAQRCLVVFENAFKRVPHST